MQPAGKRVHRPVDETGPEGQQDFGGNFFYSFHIEPLSAGSELQQHQHGGQQGQDGVELHDTAQDQALGPVVGLLMEKRKLTLAAKQEILDQVFDRALEKLCALPEEELIPMLIFPLLQLCNYHLKGNKEI